MRRLLVVGLTAACLGMSSSAWSAPAASPTTLPVTVAIFYYPWYGTPAFDGSWGHWSQNGHAPPRDVYSRYYPTFGPYSSSDPAVIDRQMSEIAGAGIGEVIVSWWGRGSSEDERLPLVMAAAERHHIAVALHLEPYEGRTPETVAADLQYAAGLGIADVYVYHPGDFAASDWAAVNAQAPATLRVFAGTSLVGFAAAGKFEGVYTYDFLTYGGDKFSRLCAQAHAVHLLCAPSVGPGYDGRRAGEAPVGRTRRNGQTYDALWAAALAAGPDVVSITSFNEWGEGTQIEPATAHRGYAAYDGAWGMRGTAADFAYLNRTSYWTARAHTSPIAAAEHSP